MGFLTDNATGEQDVLATFVLQQLAHLIAELARHAGHADIVRESIDGAIAYDPNDLAEGKEPQDWTTATDW